MEPIKRFYDVHRKSNALDRSGESMARVPDVTRRRFISGTTLDTLILISFNSGVFNLFFMHNRPFSESVGPIFPYKAFTLIELLFFLLKTGEDQKERSFRPPN